MKQFQVYFKELLVGVLYINEQGEYRYVRNKKMLDTIEKTEPVAPQLFAEQPEFGPEIPYFKVRIEANARFDQLEAGFVTDDVRLRAF